MIIAQFANTRIGFGPTVPVGVTVPMRLAGLDRRVDKVMIRREDEKDLVKRSAAGDQEAYRQLVEKYQHRAYTIAFHILKSKEDAEDVVQESFVKAYMALPHFRIESSFYTWFYRIVYNMAIDYRRKLSRRSSDTISLDAASNRDGEEMISASLKSMETPQDVLFRKEQARRIQKVLGEISDEHRTVLMLREVEGMNYEQISEVVGVNRGTVMSRLHYARKKLQKALSDLVNNSKESSVDSGSTAVGIRRTK